MSEGEGVLLTSSGNSGIDKVPTSSTRQYKYEVKPFCDFCQRSFKSSNGYLQHMQRHEPPGGYLCRYCDARYCSREERTKHVQEKHAVFRCEICKSCFDNVEDYMNHIQNVHEGQQTVYVVCEKCGQKFKTQLALNIHLGSKCGTKKTFKCEECGLNYMSKATLAAHKLIHTGEKYYCCSYCGKRFLSQGQLTVHERKHTKEKPYQCNTCNKAFSYRESLVTHAWVHTGIKPYICECCGATFSCVGNLQKHRRVRPYSCGMPQYCEKFKRIVPRASTKGVKKFRINKVVKKTSTKDLNQELEIEYLENQYNDEAADENFSKEVNHDEKGDEQYEEPSENIEIQSPIENETVEFVDIDVIKIKNDKDLRGSDTIGFFTPKEGDNEEITYDVHIIDNPVDHDNQFKTDIIDNIAMITEQNDDPDDLRFDENSIYEIISKDENDDLINKYVEVDEDIENFQAEGSNQSMEITVIANSNSDMEDENMTKPEAVHQCLVCSLSFTEPKLLVDHLFEIHESTDEDIEKHFNSSNNKTKCPFCDKTFRLHLLYTRHLDTHNRNNEIYKTKSKSEIEDRSESKFCFICQLCGKNFSSRFVLKNHERSNCGKTPRYTCEICNNNYHSAGSLKTHQTIHTGALPFLCSYCGKVFRTKGQHKVHIRKHNGEKPFKCHICPKAFPYRQSLITHVSTHTGEKPFLCHCGQSFSCVKNLISHRKTFKTTCGALPKITKPTIHIGVIKGQLYVGDKSS